MIEFFSNTEGLNLSDGEFSAAGGHVYAGNTPIQNAPTPSGAKISYFHGAKKAHISGGSFVAAAGNVYHSPPARSWGKGFWNNNAESVASHPNVSVDAPQQVPSMSNEENTGRMNGQGPPIEQMYASQASMRERERETTTLFNPGHYQRENVVERTDPPIEVIAPQRVYTTNYSSNPVAVPSRYSNSQLSEAEERSLSASFHGITLGYQHASSSKTSLSAVGNEVNRERAPLPTPSTSPSSAAYQLPSSQESFEAVKSKERTSKFNIFNKEKKADK
ncbi:hypothetical protein CPB84DRAFT_1792879 [Gymnopilus junonius]|uniref:Uncharacterized protein n=1 Tax=Gymnopilus junonius TaxID=109634 RepID=A0A9P5NBF4_GYMJU|nr:hypothetical protein CPB84DRAFT_1792879 [Gymnopilus junonius]